MSIVRIVSVFPKIDGVGPMRSLITERIRSTPGTSLSMGVVGEMTTFEHTTVFDSLEAYEKVRDSESADPAIMEHRNKIGDLSRLPVTIRLLNTIVNPTEPMGSNLRYALRTVFQPNPAGHDVVKDSLEAFAKAQQAEGRKYFRMAELIFGHDGAALTLGDSFETMAELENVTRNRQAGIKVNRAEIGAHLRTAPLHRLMEIIVPANN